MAVMTVCAADGILVNWRTLRRTGRVRLPGNRHQEGEGALAVPVQVSISR